MIRAEMPSSPTIAPTLQVAVAVEILTAQGRRNTNLITLTPRSTLLKASESTIAAIKTLKTADGVSRVNLAEEGRCPCNRRPENCDWPRCR